jgi:hypothetical protein
VTVDVDIREVAVPEAAVHAIVDAFAREIHAATCVPRIVGHLMRRSGPHDGKFGVHAI